MAMLCIVADADLQPGDPAAPVLPPPQSQSSSASPCRASCNHVLPVLLIMHFLMFMVCIHRTLCLQFWAGVSPVGSDVA